MKIRLWGTEDECRAAAERLMATPSLLVLSVSEPRADRGASVLVRVYIEARLDGRSPAVSVTGTSDPARGRRRALPPAGARSGAAPISSPSPRRPGAGRHVPAARERDRADRGQGVAT